MLAQVLGPHGCGRSRTAQAPKALVALGLRPCCRGDGLMGEIEAWHPCFGESHEPTEVKDMLNDG